MARLYARGLREYWTSTTKDFAETVFAPLVDRGFDHEAIQALEDAIFRNFELNRAGDAHALAKELQISEQNARMILAFYDLGGRSGLETAAGYEAFCKAKQHVQARSLAPLTMYLARNQTKKDITEMTQDLRERLKLPDLTQSKVYSLMWLANHEMTKAWERPVSPDVLAQVRGKLGEQDIPETLGALAIHLYRDLKWSKAEVAAELDISEKSFTHHLHAQNIEPNTSSWADWENGILRSHYGDIHIRELGELLGRTEASIRAHAKALGLTQEQAGSKPDLFVGERGLTTTHELPTDEAIKEGGVLQAGPLAAYLRKQYESGKTLTQVAQDLEVSPAALSRWNTKLGLYPVQKAAKAVDFNLGEYLSTRPKPGHAIFDAFLAEGALPSFKGGKGDPGAKLAYALYAKKSADALVNEIPQALRDQHSEAVEAFRRAYQKRLDEPLRDSSVKPGQAIFQVFLAEGSLPTVKRRVKGDPGRKLATALRAKKSAQDLVSEIPEELRNQHPNELESFRQAYQKRLDQPLRDDSIKPGQAIFQAFLERGALPVQKSKNREKGDLGTKLASSLRAKKSADALVSEIPEELRNQHPNELEAFRQAYQKRLDQPPRKFSVQPGHAIFQSFLAEGVLPPQRRGKGDPGAKLSKALQTKRSAEALVSQIPEDVRNQYPTEVEAFKKAYQSRLEEPLRDFSVKQGHVIFQAFLAEGALPTSKRAKGDPGSKLSAALYARKSAQELVSEVPEELRNQHPNELEAFRQAYQKRLDEPIHDLSRKPGHAIFEAFLSLGALPNIKRGKGDPGQKLGGALRARKSADALVSEIPEEIRNQHPEAVERFRQAYQERLNNSSANP